MRVIPPSGNHETSQLDPIPGNNEVSYQAGEAANVLEEADDDSSVERVWKSSLFATGLVRQEPWATRSFCSCRPRVGNMVILYQHQSPNKDESSPPNLICTVGPYWPMMIGVTYPLILAVSAMTAYFRIPHVHYGVAIGWSIGTALLLLSLACVACRNPGILTRHAEPLEEDWVWNDQGRTWRPPTAKYDSECACVVKEYDHTCPWTGTAIGKQNMFAFKSFCFFVATMLIFNGLLLGNPILF